MYKPFQEGIEVLGISMYSVIASLPAIPFLVDKYFIEANLPIPSEIKLDGWYSQEKWLAIFKLIAEKTGSTLYLILVKKFLKKQFSQ